LSVKQLPALSFRKIQAAASTVVSRRPIALMKPQSDQIGLPIQVKVFGNDFKVAVKGPIHTPPQRVSEIRY
jgi:hypothetical protein